MTDHRTKILVADDFGPSRAAYAGWLSEIPEVEVVEASGGQEAIALAREHEFALFVIDIGMPDIDGFVVAAIVRDLQPSGPAPVILVTGDAPSKADVLRGCQAGAADVLFSGPANGEVVLQKARVYLELQRQRRLLESLNSALKAQLVEIRRCNDQMRELAMLDPLTNLPNRRLLRDRLDAAIRHATRTGRFFAVAYVDLDGFKDINDQHGHVTGDRLLFGTAERLAAAVRSGDTVARVGGDEFVLLFENLDDHADARRLVESVHRAVTRPLPLSSVAGAATFSPGASIGVVLYPAPGVEAEDLIGLADGVMYSVKRDGGGIRMLAHAQTVLAGDEPSAASASAALLASPT